MSVNERIRRSFCRCRRAVFSWFCFGIETSCLSFVSLSCCCRLKLSSKGADNGNGSQKGEKMNERRAKGVSKEQKQCKQSELTINSEKRRSEFDDLCFLRIAGSESALSHINQVNSVACCAFTSILRMHCQARDPTRMIKDAEL